jgi:putative copper export protein
LTWALTTFQQWVLFSGTVLVVGCVAWRVQVAPRAALALPGEVGSALHGIESRVVRMGFRLALVLVGAWLLRMVVQVMGFRDPFVPLWDDVSFLLFETFWGTVWMAQGVVLTLLAAALRWAGAPGATPRAEGATYALGMAWSVVSILVVALTISLALSGHAVGADARSLAVTADAAHTLAAGGWVGSLAVILLVGRPSEGHADPSVFAAQIRAFSPMALVAGGGLVAMGVVLSWTHLHAVSDLWTSGYGRLLSAKVSLALVIFSLGFWNWKRGVPVCDRPEGAAAVRARAAWEVGLAVLVILLTAMLVHATKP